MAAACSAPILISRSARRSRLSLPHFASPALEIADLRAQVIGLAISVALFVSWVVIFQQQWRNWGTLGLNMLIYVPDATWWLD